MKTKIEGWNERRPPATVMVNGEVFKRLPAHREGVRAAYVGRSAVLKFDTEWAQCATEAKRFRGIKPKDRKYFPQLIAAGRDWILVGRVPLYRRITSKKHKELVRRLAKKYRLRDICPDYPHNCALSKGSPVIYDLGV